jgi:hypothetical protein
MNMTPPVPEKIVGQHLRRFKLQNIFKGVLMTNTTEEEASERSEILKMHCVMFEGRSLVAWVCKISG